MSPLAPFETASTTSMWLVTLTTLAYGGGPFIVDMNRTHLLHPAWPGHARFHLVWATVGQFLTAAIALGLVWSNGPYGRWRCQLALWIAVAHVGAFFVAWITARFYRGTLHDPGGIRPVAGIDGNVVACGLMAAMLAWAWAVL